MRGERLKLRLDAYSFSLEANLDLSSTRYGIDNNTHSAARCRSVSSLEYIRDEAGNDDELGDGEAKNRRDEAPPLVSTSGPGGTISNESTLPINTMKPRAMSMKPGRILRLSKEFTFAMLERAIP